jgi:hypothetical protein
MLASLQLNQMLNGEAFEEIAVWLEKEGATETAEKLRAHNRYTASHLRHQPHRA